jgi:hypothetical protein
VKFLLVKVPLLLVMPLVQIKLKEIKMQVWLKQLRNLRKTQKIGLNQLIRDQFNVVS